MTDISSKIQAVEQASSFLFVPGNRPERFDKALASGADVVILDLDASVVPGQKQIARRQVLDYLRSTPVPEKFLVRTNALGSPWGVDELKLLAEVPLLGVLLPMVERVEHPSLAESLLKRNAALISLIETARGVANVAEIAHSGHSCRLAFGNMDYETDVNLRGGRWGVIFPSSQIVVASRCAGLPSPVAGVTANFGDPRAIMADIEFEHSLGFGAKLCIHPMQVSVVNAAFAPSEEELARARRIVEATESSYAVNLDGEMVDRPVIERARWLLSGKH